MRIGVIGPESSCKTIQTYLCEEDQTLEVSAYAREQVNTCDEVAAQCEAECDAVIFTGQAVESFVESRYRMQKPYTFVEKSALTVADAFMKMERHHMELDAFSIDVVESRVIDDLLDAFHIEARNIYASSFQPGVEEQDYVDWHIRLQEEGKTNIALTSLVWVHHKLQEKGYASIYLEPTKAMVRLALERIRSRLALDEAAYSQIAVVILQLTNYERNQDNYYTSMISKAEIEKAIIGYAEGIQGALFAMGRREYILFSGAGAVQAKDNIGRLLRLLEEIRKNGIRLNAGIGMGTTANQAEVNAREALNYTLKREKQEIYRIDQKKEIEGPLGTEQTLKYDLVFSDPELQEMVRRSGLKAMSLQKIFAAAELRHSYVFDAHELAQCLGVTVRSARRIMKHLLEAGLARVCAQETAASGGRPKNLIELEKRQTFREKC